MRSQLVCKSSVFINGQTKGEWVLIILHNTLLVEIGASKIRKQLSLLFPVLYHHYKPCARSKVHYIFPHFMQNQYNLARAQQSYKSLVQIHEKNGECLSPVSCSEHCQPSLLRPNPSYASKPSKITVVYGQL